MTDTRTAYRTCPLCEAGCGLEITVEISKKGGHDEQRVTRIRGDMDDVFSHGYICPKGSTLKQLHEDPDRLRRPLVKRNGVHVEVTWPEAWDEVAGRLGDIIERHGREAVAAYLGNPGAHNIGALLYNRTMLQGLGTRRRFSASTVDQMPKQVACGYMFGTGATIPVPDLDRTDYLLMLGANPYASNGSLCTAPDFPGRIEALRARGGRLVVVDPRRSRTAEEANLHVAIRPGTDAHFLLAIVQVLFAENLVAVDGRLAPFVNGIDDLRRVSADFPPEAVARATGLEPELMEALAGLSNSRARAERIAGFLQEHFEATYAFDLEGLLKKGVKGTSKQLEKAPGMNDFTLAWVNQRALKAQTIPVDSSTLRCAKRLELVDSTEDKIPAAREALEGMVAKTKVIDFTDGLSRISIEFCHERNPACGSCPVSGECPSAKAPKGAAAPATGKARKPK